MKIEDTYKIAKSISEIRFYIDESNNICCNIISCGDKEIADILINQLNNVISPVKDSLIKILSEKVKLMILDINSVNQ